MCMLNTQQSSVIQGHAKLLSSIVEATLKKALVLIAGLAASAAMSNT